MDQLTISDVQNLLASEDATAKVSIYCPTFRAGKDVEQNTIRFRNLLKRAEADLSENGVPSSDVDVLLKAARTTGSDSMFWKHQSDGLAVFVSSTRTRTFRVPEHFRELVTVSDRFHIKPLLPLVTSDGHFYVLAISKNRVRLLQGSRYSVSEIPLPNTPASLAEALQTDESEKQVQFHTGTPSHGGRRDAVYFGGGDNEPDAKGEIRRYFQQVDKGIKDVVHDPNAPLILAGVEYMHAIFRDATSHHNVLGHGLTGNPDDLSIQELHAQAWGLVRPEFESDRECFAERFRELDGTDQARADCDLKGIVPAAHGGRVECLFVPLGVQVWGQYNSDTAEIVVHKEHRPGDVDLLDFAATHTLAARGAVYAVDSRDVPNGKHAAAIYRY